MSDRRNIISSVEKASSSRFKDPRVVRVSRALGGKDRHSKVCTVRGLRDRRVRLSVPTAIQLYSLQERLGFNQPSKVVDWLLNAAKSEIDELPPLQIPQGMFNSCTQDNNLDDQLMFNSQEVTTANTNTNTYVRLSPSSNLTLCQNPTPPQHNEYWHSFGFLPFQASTVPSGSHQVLLYHHHQPAAATAGGVMSTHSSQEYI